MRERGLLGGGRRVLDVGCHTGGLLARMPAERRAHRRRRRRAGAGARRRRAPAASASCTARSRASSSARRSPRSRCSTCSSTCRGPVEALRRLAALAAPDGRLVVEVPIAENGASNDISPLLQPLPHDPLHARRAAARAARAPAGRSPSGRSRTDYNGCRVVAATDGAAGAAAGRRAAPTSAASPAWHASAAHAEDVLASGRRARAA